MSLCPTPSGIRGRINRREPTLLSLGLPYLTPTESVSTGRNLKY